MKKLICLLLLFSGCKSGFLKYEKSEQLKDIQEFDQQVKIDAPETVAAAPTPTPEPTPEPVGKNKNKKKEKLKKAAAVSSKHLPEIEGQSGFIGRRPLKDPFRPGERVVHSVNYFNVKAGELSMSVKPFAQVNGRKAYNFFVHINTSPLFSTFYEADDSVTSLVDYENLTPLVFTMHVKESAQLREARFYIDWSKHQASYWEKRVSKKDGPEEKKLQWEVPDYSQDVFSSIFYLRNFAFLDGTEGAFRVADNEENLIFRGKVLRREILHTKIGDFKAIVIKPEIELKGKFKPVGDIFIWLSDDDRKFVLRIESKIKIGTLVSEIIQLDRGQD